MNEQDRAAILEQHIKSSAGDWCISDGLDWRCPVIRALDWAEALRAAIASWTCGWCYHPLDMPDSERGKDWTGCQMCDESRRLL